MIMLPFYLVFVACSFLLNQGSLLTIFHLIIPVADMLGYHILLNNLMLVVSFLLSIWLLPRSRKSVMHRIYAGSSWSRIYPAEPMVDNGAPTCQLSAFRSSVGIIAGIADIYCLPDPS